MHNNYSFQNILNKYRCKSFSERDKGNRFERLMKAYLLTDPKYAFKLKKVWLWNEFIGKKDLGGKDLGIDLVALTIDGDFWAIQCKCFNADTTIDKKAVDSFLTTSSREFRNEEFKTVRFSNRIWISTTNKWGSNATESIQNQHPPVTRINLYDLQQAPVDWENLENGIHGEVSRNTKRDIKPHQLDALEKTQEYFKTADRGKLIMACGTGKTFNSLRIAEKETNSKGLILFLVPSIALLGQTLREWTSYAEEPINAICICSDPEISKKKIKNEEFDSFSVVDLAMPASTKTKDILHQFEYTKNKNNKGMTVVFSTYQSIDVIARVQKELIKKGIGEFDLIICDEAHRTTGVTLSDEDESAFVKVHDNKFIKGKKRLYMTATPRLYSADSKSKAAKADAILCSMDDKELYGEEIYRIGFGKAVETDLLTDYKVLILTLSEKDIPAPLQSMISNEKSEINTDDVSKIVGCINALSKQIIGDEGSIKLTDPEPMQRSVAFCQSIAISKKITGAYNTAGELYLNSLPDNAADNMVTVSSKHIDGTMSAPVRDELLSWLKEDIEKGESRILTNVRCLSEGVDVPSLDSVMFLSAKNSQIDVVQSVGRVMRKAPGKNYGYIIIPVVIPSDIEAEKALDDNERYKVVWTVLNALRAHDDRFNATINKIDLNKQKPKNILIGGVPNYFDRDDSGKPKGMTVKEADQFAIQFAQLQNIIFAKMVQKVGDRRYWEQWAKNVAEIAERQVERINELIKDKSQHQKAFVQFLEGLRKNINPSITQQEAVEMLSQHIITRPVFDALFEGYSFIKNNPISVSMQKMLDLLEGKTIEKDTENLKKFYESVKMRASGIDNAEAKQRIIIELYDKFFKTAFPKMVEKLGIVYTPIEVVDFIIHSVSDVLKKEFGRSLSDENVHILDPFTGTGTFISRLIQSNLIDKKDLERKYKHEIHANEIVLLAYYIAAVNIENAYHDNMPAPNVYEVKKNGKSKKKQEYVPFEGICLTDTFQLGEENENYKISSEMFPHNSERIEKLKKTPLTVIYGNPPYSVGQKSANDNAQNQKYESLDEKIANTYAKGSSAGLSKSLYDPYIKAFRWSTDRLDPKHGGIVCFVSNGAWLDGNSTDGFRKCLEKEFSSIYVFNLRGNARTSGELRQKEAGNVFGGGSRTPIAITLLIKNPEQKNGKASIQYKDIGDYHNREEKLDIVKKLASAGNEAMLWKSLNPNEHGDWISQRNDLFETFIPLEPEKDYFSKSQTFFLSNSSGLATSRDAWCYNFSKDSVSQNIKRSLDFFNKQSKEFAIRKQINSSLKAEDFIDLDSTKISWDRQQKKDVEKSKQYTFDNKSIVQGVYRPYHKQWVYFNRQFNNCVYQLPKLFPDKAQSNLTIIVTGIGASKDFSALISSMLPNYHSLDTDVCFPLYYYEKREKQSHGMFDEDGDSEYIRRDGVSDFILDRARKQYGKNVTKEDIFYYVYGFLHSPEYRKTFANDLKKMLPRLPLVEDVRDFWKFSKAGRALAELHINYESVPPYKGVKVTGAESKFYTVEKMRFPSKDRKDSILYNSRITIENIPAKAYEYVVNGKSAIEWIMERYQITTHKESGIRNDPNDWAKEVGNPRYILDLLLSIINVSVQTVDIVNGLPRVKF